MDESRRTRKDLEEIIEKMILEIRESFQQSLTESMNKLLSFIMNDFSLAHDNSAKSESLDKSVEERRSMLCRETVTTPTVISPQRIPSAFTKSFINKYMLIDKIGKGEYGLVFKGLDLESGQFVAINHVSLENIEENDISIIMQDIDLLKNLNHKNIVNYLGSFETKSRLYIILEYFENDSLANIIKSNKPFPESLVTVYIAQVLEGLVYLHEHGVIHQNIKGANILVTEEGQVKLVGFRVGTKLIETDSNAHAPIDLPYWTAPEVMTSVMSTASDIWSVGCTVIELCTCVAPYSDLHPFRALFRIVEDERPPIPDSLSADIIDFLHRCFQKDASQRADAKTLLSHPWIQNSRRVLQSSLGYTVEH